MRVLGIDVCKASIVCCLLTERPADAREAYRSAEFHTICADTEGIDQLLSFRADVAVLEPTGIHYARLWVEHLKMQGTQVLYVPNNALASYRPALDLPDKDDEADALALACYWFDFRANPRRFLRDRDRTIARVRDLVLRLEHLQRLKTPVINRIRQELSWQFPEVAHVRSVPGVEDVPLLWGWIAGERPSKKYDRLYASSVGVGLTPQTRESAKQLCRFFVAEQMAESEMYFLVRDRPEFQTYLAVFNRFGFGLKMSCLLLSQVYPLEDFFSVDGKPEVLRAKGKVSGKPTKRRLSERRFKKAIGLAPVREWSGDNRRKQRKSGSALCRKAFWQWCFVRLEIARSRPKTEIGVELGHLIDEGKASKQPVRKLRSAVCSKAGVMLFRELVGALLNREK